jgi:hypothetical protein
VEARWSQHSQAPMAGPDCYGTVDAGALHAMQCLEAWGSRDGIVGVRPLVLDAR